MPTSELSNALNPYITQERPRQQVTEYETSLQQVVPHPQHYAPHRSELEHAISVPQSVPPQPAPQNLSPATNSRGPLPHEGLNPFQLLRLVATTQEIERKRRLAWEQEQEAKLAQRQAETERSMLEMRQEIQTLRAMFSRKMKETSSSQQQQKLPQTPQLAPQPAPQQPESSIAGMFATHHNVSPALQEQNMPQHSSTLNPISIGQSHSPTQHSLIQSPSNESYTPYSQPTSVEPSLRRIVQQYMQYPSRATQLQTMSPRQPQPQSTYLAEDHQLQNQPSTSLHPETMRYAAQALTPSPSPQLSVSQSHTDSSSTRRKRKTSEISSDEDPGTSSDNSDAVPTQRIRRINHHDKRCLTIQHAMRLHFLSCMELESDKQLPNSHAEGITLGDSQPVRFVWDKTTKQSVHNARMKTRILADIKAKRNIYKHVPDKDFGKKALDTSFEQCFVTFRQKFKAQHDAAIAINLKQKEDQKARRARHLSRRKIKLSNRAESRQKLSAFDHVVFDGAFQLECMSSEESDEDHASIPGGSKSGILRTRGYSWRSSRLIRFFCILDDEERSDKMTKPKRGVGKKGRCIGPLKPGSHLPPKGVATWMISRKWLSSAQAEQPDLSDVLSKLVLDPPGFDWDHFDALGLDSDAEGQEHNGRDMRQHEMRNVHMQQLDMMQMGRTQYSSTSSLNYALV